MAENVQLYCDPEKIQQVFLNLILNAFQAMCWRGELTLRIKKNTAGLKIVISDNGSGIHESIRKRIFAPFFTTKNEGTGLGLAMVQKIVEGT